MALYVTSLNSGSNGNCYYVGNQTEAVLIDAGLSCRETEKRMNRLSLDMRKVKAIFVSHEHSDHIKGITVLSKKHNLPVYITTMTARAANFFSDSCQICAFSTRDRVRIGGLEISAFEKYHDACDPCSFSISCDGITVGIFTDIGKPCENLVYHFKNCHAAILEANYDEDMLANGNYPWHLKRRISGGNGHLSNRQALELFTTHKPAFMTHLFLAHLSKNNNCPELVEQIFKSQARGVEIVVASRYNETAVYRIDGTHLGQKPRPALMTQGYLF